VTTLNQGILEGCQITYQICQLYSHKGPKQAKNLDVATRSCSEITLHFHDNIVKLQQYQTPALLQETAIRTNNSTEHVNKEEHHCFCSGVSTVLYFVKFSLPEISNVGCVIAKAMDRPNKEHMRSLMQLIKCVIDTNKMVWL
jgi:hypothetical protein